jgi:hypothetical protein
MDFLKKINWLKDDGVYLPMLNDHARNSFFEKIISQNVNNQKCTDVGFGTGLLSIIALKHGATHIRAFESNYDRYLLGCEIVDRLKLKNKIEVINERYCNNIFQTPITFSETVSTNMWGEGLYKNLPIKNNEINKVLYLPNEYITEIHTLVISKNYTQELINSFTDHNCYSRDFFAPGVDIDNDFINLIGEFSNKKILSNSVVCADNTIVKFPYRDNVICNVKSYLNAIEYGNISASCTVTSYIEDLKEIEFNIDTSQWRNSNVLVVPRYCLKHGLDKLYLDKAGSWGPAEYPIILINPNQTLRIRQSLYNDNITFDLVD